MPVYQFSLLIQAAGTVLLFLLFLLLYQKIRRRAFLDWIASWAFLLCRPRPSDDPALDRREPAFRLSPAPLASRARRVSAARSPAVPRREGVPGAHGAPLARSGHRDRLVDGDRIRPGLRPVRGDLARPGRDRTSRPISFAITPGSPAGRVLLSTSFLLWGVEEAVVGFAYLRFRDPGTMPEALQYATFAAMLLEMMVAVGIIILLFEMSQPRLASEMEQLLHSDQQLKEMGVRDPLTGLYNRHHFNDVIRRELANVRRYGISLSVLLADVDRFKEINDVKGHHVGDDVLKFVANYLTSCVRESDFVFRWGGDEFLILLPRTDEGSAAQKAEELARRMPRIRGVEQVQPSLSVGWATHRMDADFP